MRACRDANDGGLLATGGPVSIRVKGRKLPSWRSEDGVAQPVPRSPAESAEPLETIALIPYAAAKLPITAFPQLKHCL
jgi:uncharacterized protein